MNNMQDRSKQAIDDMEVSETFKLQAKKMGILTLNDVLEKDIRRYKKNPEFDYLWYADLLRLLKKEGLLEEFERRLL